MFGNGWCSNVDESNGNCKKTDTGQAGIYLMLVDPSNGAISFKFLNTNVGTTANPNGIGEVTPVDLDKDNITDYVYAGDIQGNIWRFDLTSNSVSDWEAQAPSNIFTTAVSQPVTTKINVNIDCLGTKSRWTLIMKLQTKDKKQSSIWTFKSDWKKFVNIVKKTGSTNTHIFHEMLVSYQREQQRIVGVRSDEPSERQRQRRDDIDQAVAGGQIAGALRPSVHSVQA